MLLKNIKFGFIDTKTWCILRKYFLNNIGLFNIQLLKEQLHGRIIARHSDVKNDKIYLHSINKV